MRFCGITGIYLTESAVINNFNRKLESLNKNKLHLNTSFELFIRVFFVHLLFGVLF